MKIIVSLIVSFFVAYSASANLEEIFGNAPVGDHCRSDYQCESLCCSTTSKVCNPHNPKNETPQYCNKPSGERCVASEFCEAYSVVVCKLVKAGTNADGSQACTLRCPTQLVRGSCVNNYCEAPSQPPIPRYDPRDCSEAVDP